MTQDQRRRPLDWSWTSASHLFQERQRGGFDVGVLGDLLNPHGVVENLDVDAELVHVAEAEGHVVEFAGGLGGGHVAVGLAGEFFELLLGEVGEAEASSGALDGPHLTLGVVGVGKKDGAELLLGGFEVVPSALSLDDVSVGVDNL